SLKVLSQSAGNMATEDPCAILDLFDCETSFYQPPGADIWKKLDCDLLTPPLSPSRCDLDFLLSSETWSWGSASDALDFLSSLLEEHNEPPDSETEQCPEVLQDCMWGASSCFELAEPSLKESAVATPPTPSTDPTLLPAVSGCDQDSQPSSEGSTDSNSISANESPCPEPRGWEEEIDVVTVEKLHWSSSTTAGCMSRQSSAGSSGSDSSDDLERRRTHNILERQRRDSLRSCFTRLREQLPDLRHQPRAAKVAVLRRAAEHARALQAEENRLHAEQKRLQTRQAQLRARLQKLQPGND
uniref:BHLH domain-containing protein n=1 Tax=Eptatretus burgeri TaxID=7764 RepID=A0A8C4RBN7_EPTBU